MSHSPLPGPPRSRSTPTTPAPNRHSDSSFGPLLRVFHAPLSAHHGHPWTRRVLALEQLKLNGALLFIRGFLGYVGLWAAFINLLSYLLSTTGAGVFSWVLFLVPAFNAADAVWTLRQIARTSSLAPSGLPAAASAVSRPVQAQTPKPPITPRAATRTFKYPPSPSSTPVLKLPSVLATSGLGLSDPDASFDSSFRSPSPSIRAALARSQNRTGFSQSHPPPPPIRWGSPSASLVLSSGKKEDESFDDASSFTSSLLGRSSPRVGRALDAQTLYRLTS